MLTTNMIDVWFYDGLGWPHTTTGYVQLRWHVWAISDKLEPQGSRVCRGGLGQIQSHSLIPLRGRHAA